MAAALRYRVLRPRSGMYIFCSTGSGLPAIMLRQRSAAHGVVFALGDEFSPGGELGDHLRLCVSGLSEASIRVGLQRLRQLLREITPEA